MRRLLSGAAVLTVLGVVLVPTAAVAATCTAAVLPDLPGSTAVSVAGTDYAGAYVGVAADATSQFGVVWRDGGVERLPILPYDMNRAGVVSGSVEVHELPERVVSAALLAPDGTITYLTSGYSVAAAGINDRGDAVGWYYPNHPVVHIAALWPAGSSTYETLDPDWYVPLDIDDNGVSIGRPGRDDLPQRVWSFDGTVLAEYGPYAAGDTRIDLADIDDGKIAATRTEPDGRSTIVVLDALSRRGVPLASSEGGTPLEIENGVVVGSGPEGAMLWRRTTATVLPAPAGTTTREASAVNGDGTEAAGISVAANGRTVATVWHCG
jgi:hypothetical protein